MNIRHYSWGCCLFAVVSLFGVDTQATTINVGHHDLIANTPNQTIGILVEGGELVSGLDLFVQVGDGGSELALLGLPEGTDGPALTGVELVSGTIFEGVADVPTDIGSPLLDQVAIYTLALLGVPSSVPASGTLATLMVDTTGFSEGTWTLQLSDVLPFPELFGPFTTNFAGQPADSIVNGSITIVPPPVRGDMTGDGLVNLADVPAFVLALTDRGAYDAAFPLINTDAAGDIDGSGIFDLGDTGLFSGLFGGPASASAQAVPEPGTLSLAVVLLMGIAIRQRRRV